jgi:hypothetical protein
MRCNDQKEMQVRKYLHENDMTDSDRSDYDGSMEECSRAIEANPQAE